MQAFEVERRFLEDLPPNTRARLMAAGRKRRFSKGAHIHSRGERTASMSVVLAGAVQMSRLAKDGSRTITAILAVGEPLGVLTMLSGRKRTHDAHAATDCELLVISKNGLFRLLESVPQVRDRIISLLATRLAKALEAVEDLKRLPLTARLAKLLLERSDSQGRVLLSQGALSEELGVSRNAVGTALRGLADRGAAHSFYGGVKIKNKNTLSALQYP